VSVNSIFPSGISTNSYLHALHWWLEEYTGWPLKKPIDSFCLLRDGNAAPTKLNLKFQYNAHTACSCLRESRSRSRPIAIAVVVTSKPVSSLATGTGGKHDPGGIRYSWHWVRFVEQPVLQQCVKNSSLGIKRRGPEICCKKPMQSMTQAIVMPFKTLRGRRAQPIPRGT
jgi:hypothetical protein